VPTPYNGKGVMWTSKAVVLSYINPILEGKKQCVKQIEPKEFVVNTCTEITEILYE
jgi:hypothetical protein